MQDALAHCRRELAALVKVWQSGHPDQRGLKLAMSDQMLEEVLIMRDSVVEERIDLVTTHNGRKSDFEDFCEAVKVLLQQKAVEKGYNETGVDGPNVVDDFCESNFKGHRLGEVLYKILRFQRKGLNEDLEKAAAWLFLEWKAARRR